MRWYQRFLRRKRTERDLDAELRFHLEQRIADLLAGGMALEEARRQARLEFGGLDQVKEACRDVGASHILETFLQDIRYGLRQIRRSPGFTIAAVLALALGIGANIAIFGFASSMLLRPLDATDPGHLVRAFGGGDDPLSFVDYSDYLQYRDRNGSLSNLTMFHWGGLQPVTANGTTELIQVMPVTGNYFQTLGVGAAMGRTIIPSDDELGANGVVLLSDNCWRRHFAANPNVLGKTIFIKKIPFSIIGIAPASFEGTIAPVIPQFYVPWNSPLAHPPGGHLIGRLKPGVTRAQAAADLSRIAAQLTRENHRRTSISVFPPTRLPPSFVGIFSGFAAMFLAIVGFVLLIACENIALLMMARSAARRREIGIRLALGASRARLVRQLVAENALLAIAGGAGAVAFSWITERSLTRLRLPVPMPISLTFDFDWRVLAFALAVTVLATLGFALGPALKSASTNVMEAVKEGGPTATPSKLRPSLVITQIAMCAALLIVSGALVHSLSASNISTRGFSTEQVLMATVNLSDLGEQRGISFLDDLGSRLRSHARVVSVAVTDNVPLTENSPLVSTSMQAEGSKSDNNPEIGSNKVYTNRVSPGFFATLGIPMLKGRDFTADDRAGSRPVGIVNETLARRFWPGQNPIGNRLRGPDGKWIEVIGVVRDSKYISIEESPKSFLYRPFDQQYVPTATVLIKTLGNPTSAVALVRKDAAALDPDLIVYNLYKLEDRVGLSMLGNRTAALVSGILGLLALVLGTIGTYAIMSFLVQQRRREIGVRLALGASPEKILRLIAGQGMRWTVIGLAFGISAAVLATFGLRHLLYGVSVGDPIAVVGIMLLLGATALLACAVPAIRASRIDPLDVLRDQ